MFVREIERPKQSERERERRLKQVTSTLNIVNQFEAVEIREKQMRGT